MGRLKSFLANLALSVASILIVLVLCELVVFRFVLPASDLPRNDYVDDVVRFAPNQAGVWRIRNTVAAPYRINAQGWNAENGAAYRTERSLDTLRVAFVGDSYVEALQVAHDASLASRASVELATAGIRAEPLRFGISGAPMSQYVQMIEREVAKYRPDWLVISLVHNDFDESFLVQPGRYTSAFRKLRMEHGRVVAELPPTPWRETWADTVRQTAFVRFFRFRWQVSTERLSAWMMPEVRAQGRFGANIDLGRMQMVRIEITAATEHVFRRLQELAVGMGARLLLVMDGDRQAIYAGHMDSEPRFLNRTAEETAARLGIAFLDLDAVFAANFATHRRRFESDVDPHWDEYGHAVVGAAVARFIAAQGGRSRP